MRPVAIWSPSPNYTKKSSPRAITVVVLHATATESYQSPLSWLTNKESGVSSHYLITKEGVCHYLVNENNVSWHAGNSHWKGELQVNKFSVGIELVNENDGKTEYPAAQLEVCADLCAAICKDHKISASNVIGHADIALPKGRKNDPLGFPWEKFRSMLLARGLGA